jgi:hypothetical protein
MSPWILFLAAAWATPDLTSSELEEVTKGEVVVRLSEDATQAVGAVDIAAPRDRVLEALLDFDYRVKHASILKTAEVYARADHSVSVKFEAGILGFTGAWHSIYEWDEANTRCSYRLDPARENSLESMRGDFVLTAIEGGTRVTHHSAGKPGSMYPTWLIRRASKTSTARMLESLRNRAQEAQK